MEPSDYLESIFYEGDSVEHCSPGIPLFFDFDNWGKSRVGIASMSRVDSLAIPPSPSEPVWFIEVKDFRIISHPPNAKNTIYLDNNLLKKSHDSICLITTEQSFPSEIRKRVDSSDLHFLFHYELPINKKDNAYFPSGYPLNIFQAFCAADNHFQKHFFVKAADINRDPAIPWSAVLHERK